jgi:molybdopterin/thiamine biosynthesis adenylyltransferase
LPRFLGCKVDAEAALLSLKIMVVGIGSVGRNAALHLARLQPHTLWLIDPKSFKSESLATQPIAPEDLGRPKAEATADLCKRLSPRTRVLACNGRAEELTLTDFAAADLILMAGDNLALEVFLGQVCLHLGKPLLQASVHGETLVAQVRFWANATAIGPCPACGFTAAEWAALNAAARFACEGRRGGDAGAQIASPPTMSVSALCSLSADLAVTNLLRWRLGLGQAVEDTALEYCGYTHRSVVGTLRRNPACPCDHTRFSVLPAPRPLAEATLAELASAADLPRRSSVSLTVDEMLFVELGRCRCAAPPRVSRFVWSQDTLVGTCTTCRHPVRAQPFFTHRSVSSALLGPLAPRTLSEVGAGGARWILVRADEKAVLFVAGSAPRP